MKGSGLLISLLLLLPGSYAVVAQPQAPPADAPIAITGRVQGDGKPLSAALITLWDQSGGVDPNPRTTVTTAHTDSIGNYELKNVPTGNYFVAVSAAGFVTGKENETLAKLRFVTVVGGKTLSPFNFDLVREGVITGIVTDAAGKPLTNIPITLVAQVIPDGTGPPKYAENIKTDDQGRYRIAGMPAGTYRVAAGHFPLLRGSYRGLPVYQRVFYPNVIDESQARGIDITPGSQVNGIDFNLGQPARTFTVRATIVDDRNGRPVQGLACSLSAYLNGKRVGGRGSFADPSTDRGEIMLADIPLGEYSISVPGSTGVFRKDDPQTPNYNGESAHFQVTDKDLNVEVRVSKAATVTGSVVIEGPARAEVLTRLPEMSLMVFVQTNPATSTPMMHATVRPDGSFMFTGLRAGKLTLNVSTPANGKVLPLRLIRIEQNGNKLDGDLAVQLGDEITGLRVVMAYATGAVHGVVKLDDGSVPAGLIGLASVWQGIKPSADRSVINQNGEFILQNLVAGEYRLQVVAHDAIGRNWQLDQKIKIEDDKAMEARIVFDSKVKPNPSAASKSYLQP